MVSSTRSDRRHRVVVFTPTPLLTVTIEPSANGDDVHLHSGGQGVWIARMLAELGVEACVCGPLAGETGRVIEPLLTSERIAVHAVWTDGCNGASVHDRRSGERVLLADMRPTPLSRHQVDELFAGFLAEAVDAEVCVLAGPSDAEVIPPDVYRRLACDAAALGRQVVADLSGPFPAPALEGGVSVLKISHEELLADGIVLSANEEDLEAAMWRLRSAGAANVVVSRAEMPSLAVIDGQPFSLVTPQLQCVDPRGAGDAMTAGISASLARGDSVGQAVRIGAAAGAQNVTRHGLATGYLPAISQLSRRVVLTPREET